MKSMRMLALAVMGACVFGAAGAGSASASLFHASKTGTLKGTALNTYVFNTGGAVPVSMECKKAATSGTVTSPLALSQLVSVTYSGCTVAGASVTVTSAHYLISADDGLVAFKNLVILTVPVGGCKLFILPQHVKGIAFTSSGGRLIEESNVKNLVTSGTGGTCGPGSSAGTYVGRSDVELEGGTISWKK